ncbi:response regulator [Parapusillimonas granuli]|uniref:Response regulator n=1 Tax=Parapusillimonas granuli TaxID=380911 RepID=A0A853FX32_9BURK|nr:response regulator [Parapusillimonas granuli]MBB5213862.1 CheY-like chemotaxis protein [Parapusillimonas granuli]MEB2398941.1 response regulator [Alcaligenaceae bacterium]NYT48697.1 response regulator [Parapusillimonas granuli]
MRGDDSTLIVEDNEMNARLLMHQLRHLGLDDLTHFSDARDALAWLRGRTCRLILTDWQMHPMGGAEFVRQVRRYENGAPARSLIIAVTAGAMPSDYERCMEAGVDDYLTKPLGLAALSEVLRKWKIL